MFLWINLKLLGEKSINVDLIDSVLKTGQYDLITVTHNETSTGVMNDLEAISKVIRKYPEVIFCVDAVSSAGGSKIEVDKLNIDICITSSQKSFRASSRNSNMYIFRKS